MELPDLDEVGQRIIGSLLEKQVTVPGSYPLSLNALRTACNQSSSREPVVDYDDATLESAFKELREQHLVRVVWEDRGRRTLKYHQLLSEELSLQPDERALITLLLLRGPQAPGELKSRAERLHAFADREQVETVLQRMAGLPTPLVVQLERRPGQQDRRWAHRLGAVPETTTPAVSTAVDRDEVIADGAPARDDRVRATYGTVADDYADRFSDELDALEFERWLLDRTMAQAGGPILDAGCGPGHVTAYLAARGADVTGLDLTPAMVEQARQRHPGLHFEVGDHGRLLKPPAADGWGAVLGWYSLIHLAGSELATTVAGIRRVLRPGGTLLLALHAGAQVVTMTEWLGHDVDLGFVLHEPGEVAATLTAAGLVDIEWYRRGPVASRGETTERLYVVGHTPAG